MECAFCKNTLSNKWSLKTHQQTSKKCLKLQNKQISDELKYECLYCDKYFTIKQQYTIHLNSCYFNSDKFRKLLDDKNALKDIHEKIITEEREKTAILLEEKDAIINEQKLITTLSHT